MNPPTLREVSNIPSAAELKQRIAARNSASIGIASKQSHVDPSQVRTSAGLGPLARERYQARNSQGISGVPIISSQNQNAFDTNPSTSAANAISRPSSSRLSPKVDRCFASDPAYCADLAADIANMFLDRDYNVVRDASYLQQQPEINEKMRMILVDWLVDVHLKFKLHPETFYLAVDLIDRFLAVAKVTRTNLQLVGITCMLIAAKYEEIWPPELKECIHISANTYTRDEILCMERAVCAALSFRLTVPTSYPYLTRLLTVVHADTQLRNSALFYLEHASLDYKCLRFTPAQLSNAAVYLANVTLCKSEPWNSILTHYSKGADVASFREAAAAMLDFVNYVPTTKYQAIRRKYNSSRYGEISKLMIPNELPTMEHAMNL